MTTKKVLLMVGGVVVVLAFIVICFVGAIVGFALYQVSNSEAAARSRDFLSKSEKLQADIGKVKDFGSIVTGKMGFHESGAGAARLNLKVIGERRTVNATVELVFSNRQWAVSKAVYVNSSGQTIYLLDPYDTKILIPRLIA